MQARELYSLQSHSKRVHNCIRLDTEAQGISSKALLSDDPSVAQRVAQQTAASFKVCVHVVGCVHELICTRFCHPGYHTAPALPPDNGPPSVDGPAAGNCKLHGTALQVCHADSTRGHALHYITKTYKHFMYTCDSSLLDGHCVIINTQESTILFHRAFPAAVRKTCVHSWNASISSIQDMPPPPSCCATYWAPLPTWRLSCPPPRACRRGWL